MPESIETPVPPVIDLPEKKSSNKPFIYVAIAIVILLLALGVYNFFAGSSGKTNNQVETISTSPTSTPSADLPTNNDNEQLGEDVKAIDTQTADLDNDLNNIDQGLNDQAVNLE